MRRLMEGKLALVLGIANKWSLAYAIAQATFALIYTHKKFGIIPGAYAKKFLAQYWPGKISVVLPLLRQGFGGQACRRKFSYLHRGTNSLALRVPAGAKIRAFLKQTGPLVAPSANTEGKPPAKTIAEAKKYFGERIDFYIDAGKKDSRPSTFVRILKNKTVVLREGAVKTC